MEWRRAGDELGTEPQFDVQFRRRVPAEGERRRENVGEVGVIEPRPLCPSPLRWTRSTCETGTRSESFCNETRRQSDALLSREGPGISERLRTTICRFPLRTCAAISTLMPVGAADSWLRVRVASARRVPLISVCGCPHDLNVSVHHRF